VVPTEVGHSLAADFYYSEWTENRHALTLRAMDSDRELAVLKKRIGSRIRQRRNELNVSQEALADEARMAVSYLSQVETGKRNPSIGALFRLCRVLNFEIAELFKT
jgi:DNA-binding XRE family transcriptional regulator